MEGRPYGRGVWVVGVYRNQSDMEIVHGVGSSVRHEENMQTVVILGSGTLAGPET